ncbi:LysE family translocator [Sulfitobacter donghicola]|uniref:Threonine transporter RhtB n=1 Tax=Sulfitobacter donghicola DSW-25 = KCTC 12864 = JCM 14565 TaxID=1300350 RepID=A0A073IEH8_9RHOB|nr:LysE family translocator [Sulfitobacter donghicola]KEJ88763.1 threonine transporter RhtB [Sulfitobacter donghicola DSW-25 = KCTC 12864 = JCM 14565]KIN68552.1 Transmembrane amino acid efflux protein [Sulfitobacter donghicola DSW-25 = KCTC 12864 = JCM 14565]
MIDPLTLLAFIPAALALNATPGADMMLCLAQGMRSGSRSAWAASAGISVGSMVHVMVAGLGLGAVISAFPWAFDVIRWLGIGYLLFLAFQAFRGGATKTKGDGMNPWRAFRAGFFTNLSNFKVIWFVLAFVPQFVAPDAGPVFLQFLIFGGLIAIGGFFVNGLVGVFAGTLGARLVRSGRVLGYVTGGIYTALAARLAIME